MSFSDQIIFAVINEHISRKQRLGIVGKKWCRERGTTPTTYYRWERELLSVASTTKALPETPAVAFAELPVPKQVSCNVAERSATLRMDNVSIDIYPQCGPEQLKTLVEILRTC